MKYLIILLALSPTARAATYDILYPDNEKKTFTFTVEATFKKLGSWECAFAEEQKTSEVVDALIVSCERNGSTAETYLQCPKNGAWVPGGTLKIFAKKQRWAIEIKCN